MPLQNIQIQLVNRLKTGLTYLDGGTVVSPKKAIQDAVGSIIAAIDGVQKQEFKNAFCAVRPPGHHAEKDKAMGFCIYNNVAVGAIILFKNTIIIKLQLLILMYTMVMEHKTYFMTMKKYFTFQHINIQNMYPGSGSKNGQVMQ